RGSNCRVSGASEFHSSQAPQNTVMYNRKRGVPMKRAMPSAILPNASGERRLRGSRRRRVSSGVSSRSSATVLAHLCVGHLVVAPAPVVGEQMVEDVVDRDRT